MATSDVYRDLPSMRSCIPHVDYSASHIYIQGLDCSGDGCLELDGSREGWSPDKLCRISVAESPHGVDLDSQTGAVIITKC